LIVEWSDLVERYSRRADNPSEARIPALTRKPAA
jgi:hypothetical protein